MIQGTKTYKSFNSKPRYCSEPFHKTLLYCMRHFMTPSIPLATLYYSSLESWVSILNFEHTVVISYSFNRLKAFKSYFYNYILNIIKIWHRPQYDIVKWQSYKKNAWIQYFSYPVLSRLYIKWWFFQQCFTKRSNVIIIIPHLWHSVW